MKKKLENYVSPFNKYCTGYFVGQSYLTGYVISSGKVKISSVKNISKIEEILAFDRAEVEDVNIGQVNMIAVSSFCGLNGGIWGYDIVNNTLDNKHHKNCFPDFLGIPIYDGSSLQEATRKLFGTVQEKRFPLIPGAHLPCAYKSITKLGSAIIYSATAIGIAKDREHCADLFMEDVGEIDKDCDLEISKTRVLEKLVKSVVQISKNQMVEYEYIFLDIKCLEIEEGEMGCCLTAIPYFLLAKGALLDNMEKITLTEWEKEIFL